jgi:hypothetical protein
MGKQPRINRRRRYRTRSTTTRSSVFPIHRPAKTHGETYDSWQGRLSWRPHLDSIAGRACMAGFNFLCAAAEVSNFDQTPRVHGRRFHSQGTASAGSAVMSESSQFRQYADEAMSWAIQSKTELARTWMQAAAASEPPPMGVNYISTAHRTAR